jgi:hypothetical protein
MVENPVRSLLRGSGRVLLDEVDRVSHAHDARGFIVGNLDTEFLLELHYQLDQVERIGVQILNELRFAGYLLLLNPQLLGDNPLYALEKLVRHPCLLYPSDDLTV